jgi:Putative amidoligase enzyme
MQIPQNRPTTPGNVNCLNCQGTNLPGCNRCGSCHICRCQCRMCEVCSGQAHKTILHPPRGWCINCSRCKKTCGCHMAPQILNNLRVPKGNLKVNPLNRWLGLEIELFPVGNLRDFPLPPYLRYELTRDGSLTEGGKEMVVRPLIGDQFQKGITHLAGILERSGCGVDLSCGFHAHIGAKDYGAFELRRLITVYSKIEQEIFARFTTAGRFSSRFCKPYDMSPEWYKTLWGFTQGSEIRSFLFRWLYGGKLRTMPNGLGPTRELRRHKYEECRYHGLNLHSWMQRSTIEWRHHQGTIVKDRLVFWPLFCGWVVEICGVLRDSEALQVRSLNDIVQGSWKYPWGILEMPRNLREWIWEL